MSCIQDWVIKGEYSAPLFHANCYLFSISYSIVMRYSHSNIKLCHHHLHFIISSSSPIIWPISSPIEDDGRARGWRQQRNALSEKKYFAILCQWGNTMILVGEEVLCNTLSGVIECMIIDLNSVFNTAFYQKYISQMCTIVWMYYYSFVTLLMLSMAVCRYWALWKSLPLTGEIGFAPLGCSTLRGGTLFSKFPDSCPKIQRTFVATSKKVFFCFLLGLWMFTKSIPITRVSNRCAEV